MTTFKDKVTIVNGNGLHARPAGKVVALANTFEAEINILLNDNQADARSIISLMTLTASCGCELEIEANGPDAKEAVTAIVDLIKNKFDEK